MIAGKSEILILFKKKLQRVICYHFIINFFGFSWCPITLGYCSNLAIHEVFAVNTSNFTKRCLNKNVKDTTYCLGNI